MQPGKESNELGNPYAAPSLAETGSQTWVHADPETVNPETTELRTFVGAKADYYLSKWAPLLKGRGRDTGFNWPAFFLSGLWIAYRKMYKVSAIFFGIIILESLAEEVLFVGILGNPEIPAGIDRVSGLVAALVCGGFGNRWYLSHARKAIAEVHASGLEQESRLRMIARRGGTNLLASLAVFFLFMIITASVVIACEILF